MAVAGASVGVLSAVIAILVVPSMLALLGTRIDALSIRRGPAVSDESDGWYRLARGVMRHPVARRPGQLGAAAGRRRAAALDDADRPQRRGGAAGQALLRSQQLRRSPLPARRHRGGHRHRRRAAPARPSWRPSERRIEAVDGVVRGTPFVPRLRPGRLRQLRPRRHRARAKPPRTRVKAIRALPPPARDGRPRLRQHRRLHRPEAEPDRTPAAAGRDHRLTTLILLFLLTGSVLLPLKTLLMNAMTLGATLGILVLAFQDGWLDGLFAYTGPARGRGDQPGLPLRGRSSASPPTTRCW